MNLIAFAAWRESCAEKKLRCSQAVHRTTQLKRMGQRQQVSPRSSGVSKSASQRVKRERVRKSAVLRHEIRQG